MLIDIKGQHKNRSQVQLITCIYHALSFSDNELCYSNLRDDGQNYMQPKRWALGCDFKASLALMRADAA